MQEILVPTRCWWAQNSQLEIVYHDTQWGVPTHDDKILFEFLLLEGAQAGLSWATILKKREGYRRAFAGFDITQVARFGEETYQALLMNAEIVRNRSKIKSAIQNARVVLNIQEEFGSFDAFLWRFVDGVPRHNAWNSRSEIPVQTPESDALSKELKRRGCNFVGSTICYSFMQAMGMVNDHTTDCFRWHELQASQE
jgi:DNA-3-methyladenine glycosylase I